MTKKERELMHDKLTYQMMENVNRHAVVQEMIQEEDKEGIDMVKLTIAFCAGCLVTVAASMLLTLLQKGGSYERIYGIIRSSLFKK